MLFYLHRFSEAQNRAGQRNDDENGERQRRLPKINDPDAFQHDPAHDDEVVRHRNDLTYILKKRRHGGDGKHEAR